MTATNLIAIRRLALDVGHASDAPAARLRVPELTLERLEQRYHRVGLDIYDYEAPGTGYAASLQVSDVGFVTRYPGLWEQEATGNGHGREANHKSRHLRQTQLQRAPGAAGKQPQVQNYRQALERVDHDLVRGA